MSEEQHSETFLRLQQDERMRKALIEHDEREMLRWKVIKGIQRRRPNLKWIRDYSLPPVPLVAIHRTLIDSHV
jgi:hypothetical protein